MATFTANIPTSVAYNATADITFESSTLSDTGSFAYGTYKMLADGQARVDTDGTSDYMLVESSNPAVATVTRAGADKWTLTPVKGGETTITVTPYYNGVAYTALKQTKTVYVTYPNESLSGAANFIVKGIVGNDASDATDLITSEDVAIGTVASANIGTNVTLTATSTAGLKFLYWYDGNSKRMLSDEETYSFRVGTKGAIYARYAKADEKLVEYFSAAGQLIDESEGSFNAEADAKAGSYYELYKDATAGTSYEATTVTSEDANFVCWTKDGKVVSYDASYTYVPWTGDEDVVAETEGEKSDVPAVVLFTNGNAHMLELVNFEGVEIVEKGILFGNGSPNVNNFGAKAVALENTKQFVATSDATDARAYVIYRDGGSYRVAYSD